jgi:hypothetical protein
VEQHARRALPRNRDEQPDAAHGCEGGDRREQPQVRDPLARDRQHHEERRRADQPQHAADPSGQAALLRRGEPIVVGPLHLAP